MDKTKQFQIDQSLRNGGLFSFFMPPAQRFTLLKLIKGEEGEHFVNLLWELKHRIETMPKTYETDKVETAEKIVYLHYFAGGYDAWVVEKDICGDDEQQHQAFGTASFSGLQDAEWGYVSIQEAIENGVELDLYWEPRSWRAVEAGK